MHLFVLAGLFMFPVLIRRQRESRTQGMQINCPTDQRSQIKTERRGAHEKTLNQFRNCKPVLFFLFLEWGAGGA